MGRFMKSSTLYFHYPCFDGLVSGVLACEFLEKRKDWNIGELHPVDYTMRDTWLASELRTPCAIVDFLYHSRAEFWALTITRPLCLAKRPRQIFSAEEGRLACCSMIGRALAHLCFSVICADSWLTSQTSRKWSGGRRRSTPPHTLP